MLTLAKLSPLKNNVSKTLPNQFWTWKNSNYQPFSSMARTGLQLFRTRFAVTSKKHKDWTTSSLGGRNYGSLATADDGLFVFSEEVKQGFADGKAIVALESTIITHGMPFPKNLETAKSVEQIVRDQGAVPATIALLEGRVRIGLPEPRLSHLASAEGAVKVSRRDLPRAIALRLAGGTTVAATMLLAARSGIHVFVTGGIGGVHRGGESSMDISADLTELGRTPVCVVSSGVKSILDIGRTLEYLETQGVCVSTYGDSQEFPAFYTRRSGFQSPGRVSSPSEAAQLVRAVLNLQLGSGLLVAVPVPEEFALEESLIETAIQEALKNTEDLGIKGKDVTPFILAAVARITEGRSLETNMALIKNNAKIGSQIAVELNGLSSGPGRNQRSDDLAMDSRNESLVNFSNFRGRDSDGESNKSDSSAKGGEGREKSEYEKIRDEFRNINPVVIGGSNVDYTIRLLEDLKLDGSTHRARVTRAGGGVGANLARCLRALGSGAALLGAARPGAEPARYVAVLDGAGECRAAFGDMGAHEDITPDLILQNQSTLEKAPLIMMDGNLPQETVDCVLDLAEQFNKPVFFEPTDKRKATKPFENKNRKPLAFTSPNLNELVAMASYLGHRGEYSVNDTKSILQMCKTVMQRVENLIVTMGQRGVLIVRRRGQESPFFTLGMVYMEGNEGGLECRLYPGERLDDVRSVSGAGDCLGAGLALAALLGASEAVCVSVGLQAARVALTSVDTIPRHFFDHLHPCWNTKAACTEIII